MLAELIRAFTAGPEKPLKRSFVRSVGPTREGDALWGNSTAGRRLKSAGGAGYRENHDDARGRDRAVSGLINLKRAATCYPC